MMNRLWTPSLILGHDQGYNENADVITQTADGADINAMWDEFQQTIQLLNRDRTALVQLLTFNVARNVEQIRYPAGDEFEEASEYGEPKGIRLGPAFNLGFDFKWYDLAIRYTWMFLAEATQAQVEALNNSAIEADNRLLFVKILSAIFDNRNREASIQGQDVPVYPFYNGDGTVPPKWKTHTFDGTETHYLVSGAATVDSGDLDDMANKLTRKGYGLTRGYRLVLLVNEQEGKTIRKFRVSAGDGYDFIPGGNAGGGVVINGQVVGAPEGAGLPGEIGTYGPWRVVVEDYLPPGYMLGFATGGEKNIGNPVGIREHANASLRGLTLIPGNNSDYPLVDSYYRHGFGTGVRHRGAGVVMQIKSTGTYDIPAGYSNF